MAVVKQKRANRAGRQPPTWDFLSFPRLALVTTRRYLISYRRMSLSTVQRSFKRLALSARSFTTAGPAASASSSTSTSSPSSSDLPPSIVSSVISGYSNAQYNWLTISTALQHSSCRPSCPFTTNNRVFAFLRCCSGCCTTRSCRPIFAHSSTIAAHSNPTKARHSRRHVTPALPHHLTPTPYLLHFLRTPFRPSSRSRYFGCHRLAYQNFPLHHPSFPLCAQEISAELLEEGA